MSLSSHTKRYITALFLLPLLGVAIYLKGVLLFLTILVVSSIGLWEFYSLFWQDKRYLPLKVIGIIAGGLILYSASLGQPWVMLAQLMALFWGVNLLFLFQYGREGSHPSYGDMALLLTGQFYLPLLLQFFLSFSSIEIVYLLVTVFATDTGAFYAGTYLGRRKVWPAISPKKTWMGSMGGMAACLLTGLAIGLSLGKGDVFSWIIAGLLINIAAQFGDFFESAVKRSVRIKDSGNILPGHGGMLDRIDSLLLAIPVYALLRTTLTLF
jgi:phosphatidate cytidylyltransferase